MSHNFSVVIVGAGIVGCSVAYELARRGLRVLVLDRREVGQGATKASAGILAPFIEAHDRGLLLELTSRSLGLYDEFVANVVEDSGAVVQYVRTGTLEIATDHGGLARVEAIHKTCLEYGFSSALLDVDSVQQIEPHLSRSVLGGVVVEAHGFVGASDLTAALHRAAITHGVKFETTVAATRITRNGSGISIETTTNRYACDSAVMAAGSWSGCVDVEGAIPIPIRPVRGQLLHLGWSLRALSRVLWAPGCYLVAWKDGSVLVGATVEEVGFDERATVKGVRTLIDKAQRVIPKVAEATFREARVGLRPATPDDLPVIGPSVSVPGLVYACGHFRNGILLAPLTAALVSDLVTKQISDSAFKVTTPARFGEC